MGAYRTRSRASTCTPAGLAEPMPQSAESLLEFPTAFPIKVMGRTQDGFAQAIVAVVQRHAPDFDPATMEMRRLQRHTRRRVRLVLSMKCIRCSVRWA